MESNIKISDFPENERPRERLLRYGPQSLSNSELIAIIIGNGTHNENVITLSSRIIKEKGGLNGLLNCTGDEFMNIFGIGTAKAAKLLAVAELSKRFKSYKSGEKYKISSPKDAADLLMDSMRYLNKEFLKVIMLNVKNEVIGISDVSMGSLNSSIVHPREVFIEPLKKSSASIIICHNHPSGDPTPSSEDVNVTTRLKECGKILGIELIDHIIIGDGKFISLKEKGVL